MIYVLSDIHGHKRRFDSVMAQIRLQPDDTLYVLGDVIDRNPDGIKILRQLMAMPNVKMLLGNHELMMLNALYEPFTECAEQNGKTSEQCRAHWYRNGGEVTHNHLKHLRKTLREEIFTYLVGLPINEWIEVGGRSYLLTHAAPVALYSSPSRYSNERDFAVWYRFTGDEKNPCDRTVIFGHTGTHHYQPDNPMKIWHGDGLIGIDCGASYPDGGNPRSGRIGRLACLRLDDMREFYSREIIDTNQHAKERNEKEC